MDKQQQIGKIGEEAALKHLLKRGYLLLEHNWRHRRFEIDLIFLYKEQLIFVEVKTRTYHPNLPTKLPGISEAQQNRIFEAAVAYAEQHQHQGEIRFDLITVLLASDGYLLEVEHLPNAFFPGMPFF